MRKNIIYKFMLVRMQDRHLVGDVDAIYTAVGFQQCITPWCGSLESLSQTSNICAVSLWLDVLLVLRAEVLKWKRMGPKQASWVQCGTC